MNRKANILLVDDRPENLLALEAILDGLGHNLIRASSGEEALKHLLKHEFAVILLDVQMPGMNGFETARLIKEREKSRHIPIVFLTAISKDAHFVFKGYSVGAVDYLFKPFNPDVLKSKVAVFIELFLKNEQIRQQAELLRQAERREQERQLAALERASQQRYRNLADAIPQIVWTARPDGTFSYFNERWFDYTGLARAQCDAAAWESAFHPEDLQRYLAHWRRAAEAGAALEVEGRLRRAADQSYRWHLIQVLPEQDADGRIVAWLGTCTDIDDRIRAREALLDQNRRVEAEVVQRTRELVIQKRFVERVVDNAPAGIAYLDQHLTYRLANPEFARLLGLSQEALLGRPAVELPLGDEQQMQAQLLQVLASGESCRCLNMPFAAPAGDRTCHWDITFYPVLGEDGQIEGVLIFTLEVSDRVENERLQREQIAHLQQVDRLKGEFLSVISHELRTPLNYIMGFASILGEEMAGPLSEQQHGCLQNILSGSRRMLLLVNDLLDFTKMQSGKFELAPRPTEYVPLAMSVLEALRPLAEQKRITLRAELQPALLAHCDESRTVQLLTNLLDNAIKFTPAGGTVQLCAFLQGGELVTEVRDDGIGIAAEDLPRLFSPFHQLDMSSTRQAGGTGLGLCICKALVESHGGRITAASPGPGQGAVFRFTLPAAVPGVGAAEAAERAAAGRRPARRRKR
ncbi:MAG: PAS domain-containing protein [Pseudomonadota bacterium]